MSRALDSIGFAAIVAGLAHTADAAPPAIPILSDYVPAYHCVRDLHVDAAAAPGGDGSAEHPWKSPQAANDSGALRAGDCVDLASGVYNLDASLRLTAGGSRNTPDGYVVYRSAELHGAHLIAHAGVYQVINIQTAYIVIDGLDIDGNHVSAGEALSVAGNPAHHHVVVAHNVIHDAGGGGLQMNDSEYFWVIGNLIYGNAASNTYQESGISTYQAQAATDFTPTKADEALPWHIIIAGNISRDNGETYACTTPGCHTDGNGIIVDKTLNVDRQGGVAYTGGVLVAGNLVYGNGGAGIQVYLSQRVTVANNTVYDNHLDTQNGGTWRGELSNINSDQVAWINNIACAVPGAGILANNSAILEAATDPYDNAAVTWTHNLTCGGGVKVDGVGGAVKAEDNLFDRDPRFTDPAGHDFTLRNDSPARQGGASEPWLSAPVPDIGAF
jgi:serralysin